MTPNSGLQSRAASAPPARAAGKEQPERWLPGLLTIFVAVLAAWNSQAVLGFDFVAFDDDINVLVNPQLGPPGADALHWMFTDSSYMRRYVPLGWLSFSVVYAFSGLEPLGYHAAVWLLHATNAALVFAVLLLFLRRFRSVEVASRSGTRAESAAAAAGAALWALHPMRAETVGWASGLLYAVATMFALLSVLTYLRAPAREGRSGKVCAAGFLYLCSVFTYPMGLGLAAVYLAVDVADAMRAKAGFRWQRRLLEKAALLVPGLLAAGASLVAGYTAPSFWPAPAGVAEFGYGARLQQAVEALGYYLWRPFWPVGLTPAPTLLFEPDAVRFGATAGALVLAVVVSVRLRAWGVLLLGGVFGALLAPMLGWTERTYFPADRYAYLPAVAMAALLAAALRWGAERRASWLFGLAVAGAVVGGWLQRAQLQVWRDTDTLLQRIVARAGDPAYRSHTYTRWVQFHLQRGQLAAAEAVVNRAAVAEADAHVLGPARAAVLAARAAAESGAGLTPPFAQLHHNVALDFRRAGRNREAGEHLRAAARLAPASTDIAFNRAMLTAQHGAALEAWGIYAHRLAHAAPEAVPAGMRTRLLTVIAERFAEEGNPANAIAALSVALRQPGLDAATRAALVERQSHFRATAASSR